MTRPDTGIAPDSAAVHALAPAGTAPVSAGRLARRRRVHRVILVASIVTVVAAIAGLLIGDQLISPARAIAGLFGSGDAEHAMRQLRLPRIIIGALAGAAFALSGAILQVIARNPLASPDLIGISVGASAAAVFSILVLGWSGLALSGSAIIGALVAAALIYLLSHRGGVSGYRLVLVGIGIAAMGNAVVSFLITRAALPDVQVALGWLVGTLHGRFWGSAVPLVVAFVLLMPFVVWLYRPLIALSLGDDLATGLGIRAERARAGLLLVAVLAAAIATAATGPIAFVALVSAPIAKRLLPGGEVALIPSMLIGAAATLIADIIAQHILPGTTLPAGVVTGAIGAPYLLWLLVRTNRVGRG